MYRNSKVGAITVVRPCGLSENWTAFENERNMNWLYPGQAEMQSPYITDLELAETGTRELEGLLGLR